MRLAVWYPRRRPCGVAINTLVDLTNWLGKPQVLELLDLGQKSTAASYLDILESFILQISHLRRLHIYYRFDLPQRLGLMIFLTCMNS